MPKAIARITTTSTRFATRRASYGAAAVNAVVLLFQPPTRSKAQRIAVLLDAVVADLPAPASIPNAPKNPHVNAWGRINPADADGAIAWDCEQARVRRETRRNGEAR